MVITWDIAGERPSLIGLSGSQPEIPHPNQIIGSNGQGEVPRDLLGASVSCSSQNPDGLDPAEYLLDALPDLAAVLVSRMAGGSTINGRTTALIVLGHMRGNT